MKRYLHFIFMLPLLLYLAGCEQTRPGVIKNLIFSEGEQWLERDTSEDSYELVGGQCCNDYYPHPLTLDTTFYPVIAPAGDLDYFDLQTTGGNGGWLSLWSQKDNLTLRIFSSSLKEYEEVLLDTFYNPAGDMTSPEYWTTFLFLNPTPEHPESSLTILVAGESKKAQGNYTLKWHNVVEEPDLRIDHPRKGVRWRRSNWELINWAVAPGETVKAALLKDPVIIQFLGSENNAIYDDKEPQLDWHIPDDLEPGTGYRIMLFLAKNPKRMNISDAFEIY